jgi:hypothetical protein
MKQACIAMASVFAASTAFAETINFDTDPPGRLPGAWRQGVTGKGAALWAVRADESAPSRPHVLQQSATGAFPWCVLSGSSIENGFVEVRFRPLSGNHDQAGGIVWRWKDGDNYYVARANALEGNVSLFHTTGGRRITLQYVDAPVAKNAWRTLRVEFAGTRIKVALDGKTYLELEDAHISGAGAVGLWTKADSVTAFDDFSYGTIR